jgi:hypothetical protein
MNETSKQTPAGGMRAQRGLIINGAVVVAVMALGTVVLRQAQAYYRWVLDKPPAPLSKPLHELAEGFDHFVKLQQPDGTLPEGTVEALGTKDYLLRTYRYSGEHPAGQGPWEVSLNLNYYANGDASPHVPEVCWVGNGRQPPEADFVTVKDVTRKDGSHEDIRMKLLSFLPSRAELANQGLATGFSGADTTTDLRRNVAYVFNVNGQYVADPMAVKSLFWNPKNKFAYHAKIEVTMEQLCTRAQAAVVLSAFMRDSLAAVEECLPDPKILTEGLPAATAPSSDGMK